MGAPTVMGPCSLNMLLSACQGRRYGEARGRGLITSPHGDIYPPVRESMFSGVKDGQTVQTKMHFASLPMFIYERYLHYTRPIRGYYTGDNYRLHYCLEEFRPTVIVCIRPGAQWPIQDHSYYHITNSCISQ